MRFFNDYDLATAKRLYCRDPEHPVLGPAVRTMESLMDGANRCSDGWAYWPKPCRAANKLIELIERNGTNEFHGGPREDATEAELRAANRVLKSFRTRFPQCKFVIYGPGGDDGPVPVNQVDYRVAGWPKDTPPGTHPAHAVVTQEGDHLIITFVPAEVADA